MVPATPDGQNVSSADWKPQMIRGPDGAHGHDLRRCALGIGQMLLANFSPTVTTIRFQPIIVPQPSEKATATFTQSGMNLVSLSICVFKAFVLAVSAAPSIFFCLISLPSAS